MRIIITPVFATSTIPRFEVIGECLNINEFPVFHTNKAMDGDGAFLVVPLVIVCGRLHLITPGRVNDNSGRLNNCRVRIGSVFCDVVC